MILAVAKVAEDGEGLLVRGFETAGRATRVVVTSDALGRSWEGEVRGHQVWTWLLPTDGGEPVSMNLLEEGT